MNGIGGTRACACFSSVGTARLALSALGFAVSVVAVVHRAPDVVRRTSSRALTAGGGMSTACLARGARRCA